MGPRRKPTDPPHVPTPPPPPPPAEDESEFVKKCLKEKTKGFRKSCMYDCDAGKKNFLIGSAGWCSVNSNSENK